MNGVLLDARSTFWNMVHKRFIHSYLSKKNEAGQNMIPSVARYSFVMSIISVKNILAEIDLGSLISWYLNTAAFLIAQYMLLRYIRWVMGTNWYYLLQNCIKNLLKCNESIKILLNYWIPTRADVVITILKHYTKYYFTSHDKSQVGNDTMVASQLSH